MYDLDLLGGAGGRFFLALTSLSLKVLLYISSSQRLGYGMTLGC